MSTILLAVKIGSASLSLKHSLSRDGSTAWIRSELDLLRDLALRLNPCSTSS